MDGAAWSLPLVLRKVLPVLQRGLGKRVELLVALPSEEQRVCVCVCVGVGVGVGVRVRVCVRAFILVYVSINPNVASVIPKLV